MATDHATGAIIAKRYRLDDKLGEGGMGTVWAATHTVTRKRVALKFLKPRAHAQVQRFMREARAASAVEHPNVVVVHDIFELEDGMPVMVMELLVGESLHQHLLRRGRLPVAELAQILLPTVSGVGAAHAAGVVHRDLKPDNIFLARDEAGALLVKVLDFGIAKLTGSDELSAGGPGITKSGALLGTPYYMSPEQACGEHVDHRSDIWSLGIIAYQALTGVLPTRADSVGGVLKVVMTARIPPLSSCGVVLPADLVDLITRMLSEHARDRPADLCEVSAVLQRHAQGVVLVPFGPASQRPSVHTPYTEDASVKTKEWLADRQQAMVSGARDSASLEHAETIHASHAVTPAHEAGYRTTTGTSATASPNKGGSLPMIVLSMTALLLAGAGSVWWLSSQGGEPDAADSGTTLSSSAQPEPSLRPPRLGLKALSHYRDPEPSKASTLVSATWWDAAAHDFSVASEQQGAPPRWRSAKQFAIGKAEHLRGRQEAALAAFRKSIALDPEWAVPHTGLAEALAHADDEVGAMKAAQEAQRLDPDWWGAVAASARVQTQANKLSEAMQEYRRALAMAPGEPVLLAELALVYHAARLDSEARRHADQALKADPDMVSVRVMLAELALERSDGNLALEQATRAVAVAPQYPAARLAFADALVLLGKDDEARQAYEETLRLLDKTGEHGMPTGRIEVVREALKHNRLPPPRAAQGSRAAKGLRAAKSPPRTARPPKKSNRTSGKGGCRCAADDLMCNLQCADK